MTKYNAFGTTLAWDPAGGSSYTTIAQIHNISPPGLSRNTIDVTTHDSTNMWMEFIKGLKDGGEVSFEITYDPALGTHDATTGLLSDFGDDDTIPNWQVTFPDSANTQWTFPGFVTGFEPTAPIDNKLAASITIKVSGEPTLA